MPRVGVHTAFFFLWQKSAGRAPGSAWIKRLCGDRKKCYWEPSPKASVPESKNEFQNQSTHIRKWPSGAKC